MLFGNKAVMMIEIIVGCCAVFLVIVYSTDNIEDMFPWLRGDFE